MNKFAKRRVDVIKILTLRELIYREIDSKILFSVLTIIVRRACERVVSVIERVPHCSCSLEVAMVFPFYSFYRIHRDTMRISIMKRQHPSVENRCPESNVNNLSSSLLQDIWSNVNDLSSSLLQDIWLLVTSFLQFVVVTTPGYMVVSDIVPGYVEDRLVITEAYTKCYTPESRWYL